MNVLVETITSIWPPLKNIHPFKLKHLSVILQLLYAILKTLKQTTTFVSLITEEKKFIVKKTYP